MKLIRRLKQRIQYEEGYFTKAIAIIGTLLIIDLIFLYLVW